MSLRDTVMAAVKDFREHGYDGQWRLEDWARKIRQEAVAKSLKEGAVMKAASESLKDIFINQVDKGKMLPAHRDIPRFTIEQVKPQLRAELDRRILASANLIKLNREEMIGRTLKRFEGWATSIPKGGTDAGTKTEAVRDITRPLADQSFLERRVHIDQGHKLVSAINGITAVAGGAIAAKWSSRYRQAGYDYRPEHKERDGKVYMIRGNWAQEQGLAKVGPDGYTDEITQVGEQIGCRCSYIYLYSLRKLPNEMLTEKGKGKIGE